MYIRRKFEDREAYKSYYNRDNSFLFEKMKFCFSPIHWVKLLLAYMPPIILAMYIMKLLNPISMIIPMFHIVVPVIIALLCILKPVRAILSVLIKGLVFWVIHPYKANVYVLDFVLCELPVRAVSFIVYTIKYVAKRT